MTKKALPYTKEFDRAEWASFCSFAGHRMHLARLELSVVTGRVADVADGDGAEDLQGRPTRQITKEEFEGLRLGVPGAWKVGVGGVDLEWAEEVMQIRGLRRLEVRSLVERCPVPRSEGMRWWVEFSGSVEGGFREWLQEKMVA